MTGRTSSSPSTPTTTGGTAVASGELALLAGGQRIEGTLFGNGERTGNVDIITMAMNLFTHGVDPQLDFSDMPKIVECYERLTGMSVGYRQPYSGHLVFAAFSGSHQDAIAKGMHFREEREEKYWTVPYLPLDPHDVNREYETDVIRINSQSGKGGISYILEHNFGYDLPKEMATEVGYFIKGISDHAHKELTPARSWWPSSTSTRTRTSPSPCRTSPGCGRGAPPWPTSPWPSAASSSTSAPGATAPWTL